MSYKYCEFKELVGKRLKNVVVTRNHQDDPDQIMFYTEDGLKYRMNHEQDCCESVTIDDINGEIEDLVGLVTMAEESSNQNEDKEWGDSETWTFYRIATEKGSVVIKWYGTSNGYYSESVQFSKEFA